MRTIKVVFANEGAGAYTGYSVKARDASTLTLLDTESNSTGLTLDYSTIPSRNDFVSGYTGPDLHGYSQAIIKENGVYTASSFDVVVSGALSNEVITNVKVWGASAASDTNRKFDATVDGNTLTHDNRDYGLAPPVEFSTNISTFPLNITIAKEASASFGYLTVIELTLSSSSTTINVDIPLHINLKWDTTHQLAVTHDGGTTTLSGVTLSAPTGWETVSFSTIPDTGTTESFYEYSQSDVTVGNFTAQVGDTLAFTSSTGLTIDGSSIPVVDPAATVTGSYKWWDASLSTWTPVSSYTITNLGVFGGSDTTVMIQEMISDMISEMVN